MNTRAVCCVNTLVVAALSTFVTFMGGCGPRTYTPSTPAEKAAYTSLSGAYATMDSGYAEKKPEMVLAYRQTGFSMIDEAGQFEDPDRMKADVDAKILMADSIGCRSTIRGMHLTGATATVDIRERIEWSMKLPTDMPKGFALSAGDAMPSMIETTVAKDTWNQTPQGWFLAKREVRTHHMAAHRGDQ